MRLHSLSLPPAAALVLAAAVAFSLVLQALVPGDLFYSGDAGLKALQTEQFSRGDSRFSLEPVSEPWVEKLWSQGLFPFGPPFVYSVGGSRYSSFPPLFALISSPGFLLFGPRGLLLLPLLALWAVWVAFLLVSRRLGISPAATAAGLAALAFATPLTLYCAQFWEHLPAVALATWGLALLWLPAGDRPSPREALAAGLLLGAAIWLREEIAVVAVAALVLALPLPGVRLSGRAKLAFTLALTAAAVSLALFNEAAYGHLLGVHAFQALADPDHAGMVLHLGGRAF